MNAPVAELVPLLFGFLNSTARNGLGPHLARPSDGSSNQPYRGAVARIGLHIAEALAYALAGRTASRRQAVQSSIRHVWFGLGNGLRNSEGRFGLFVWARSNV